MRFFGLEGLFRYTFPTEASGIVRRHEAGAFLDFKALRVYGTAFWEPQTVSAPEGVILGALLYF
jgi:hypothetical protein